MTPWAQKLTSARVEAQRARKRLMMTLGALQVRLHPKTMAAHAREGVKEKSRDLAEDAIQVVKDRPLAVSGVAAGVVLFLARGPLWSAISGLWGDRELVDESIVTANLDTHENYDLTAPAARPVEEARSESMTPTNTDDVANAPEQERGRLSAAGDRIRETATSARAKAGDAYGVARERTRSAYDSARDRASGSVEANPAVALIGGLAIGALVAAVLPRTKQEAKLLGEWGKKLNAGARDIAKKAKETSITKLDEFGVSTAKEKLKELAGNKSGK